MIGCRFKKHKNILLEKFHYITLLHPKLGENVRLHHSHVGEDVDM